MTVRNVAQERVAGGAPSSEAPVRLTPDIPGASEDGAAPFRPSKIAYQAAEPMI